MSLIKNYSKYLLILLTFFCLSTHAFCQKYISLPPAVFSDEERLPSGLLSSKTVVVIEGLETSWKEMAEKIHSRIKVLGIDPIAYFNEEGLNSGIEIRKLYARSLKNRGVKNIALFRFQNGSVKLFLTPFNGTQSFYNTGQPAWKINAAEIEQCLTTLYRKVGQSKMKRMNFLIAEVPEYFTDVPLIGGRRVEQFAQDLKLDKMAVVLTPKLKEVEGTPGIEQIREINMQWEKDSIQLTNILKEYPFQYDIISYPEDEEDLRTLGFHFILYQLYSSGAIIKSYLDYDHNPNETDYISIMLGAEKPKLKTIPVQELVYKYYVKHIYSKDIFLGKDWDADQNWELSLRNYIAGLKIATKVK